MSHLIFSINFVLSKVICLVTLFDRKQRQLFFDVECDFFCDFQTLCTSLPFFKKDNGSVKKLSVIHHSDISKSFPPTFIRLKKSYKLNYELFFPISSTVFENQANRLFELLILQIFEFSRQK